VGFVLREDTAYSSGFSEAGFGRIVDGQPQEDVRRVLGTPYAENWFYPPHDQPERASMVSAAALTPGCRALRFERGLVVAAFTQDACRTLGIQRGTPVDDVKNALGLPREACWGYSWSPGHTFHRIRTICFWDGHVDSVVRQWTWQ
jgi:hypothetical protein